jgi:hypothetical protein
MICHDIGAQEWDDSVSETKFDAGNDQAVRTPRSELCGDAARTENPKYREMPSRDGAPMDGIGQGPR